jgi:hypothetical protein
VSKLDAFEAFVNRIKYPALGVTHSAGGTHPAAASQPAGQLTHIPGAHHACLLAPVNAVVRSSLILVRAPPSTSL